MRLFNHYSAYPFNKNDFIPIENIGWITPSGGYWGTLANSDYSWEQYLHWINLSQSIFPLTSESNDGCTLNCPTEYQHKTTFGLKDESKLYCVNNLNDLHFILNKYPGNILDYNIIDYEAICKSGEFDAIYFDHNMSNVGNQQSLFAWLYNRGCDMVLVLNPDSIQIISEEKINNTMND